MALTNSAARIYLTFSHLFTMNAFDPLLWTLLAWLIVDIIQTGKQLRWVWIGGLVGVTLLNKCGVLFFVGGLLAGVLASPTPKFRASVVLVGGCSGRPHRSSELLMADALELPFLQLINSVRAGRRDVMLPPLPILHNTTT
jgi:hypothetical protein